MLVINCCLIEADAYNFGITRSDARFDEIRKMESDRDSPGLPSYQLLIVTNNSALFSDVYSSTYKQL